MRNDQQARRIEVECGVVVFLVVTPGPGAAGTLAPAKQGNGKGTARIAAEVLALTGGAHQARYGERLEIRCTTAAV